MGAVILPKHKTIENAYELEGLPVRHWAYQGRDVDGIAWGKKVGRNDFKPLPDHEYCIYARTQVQGIDKAMKDVFYLRDDDEVHIYEIL